MNSNNNGNIMDLFESTSTSRPVFISAPMVRYSKYPFRQLVRKYGADIVYTPMIIASSFVESHKCRDNEFVTGADDESLVVQFASNNADEFSIAANLICHDADGVDINCGCPQRWAINERLGVAMIEKPELISDIVTTTRRNLPGDCRLKTVSVKIRLRGSNVRNTVSMCEQLEKAGVSYISVHGRTARQRPADPVDYAAIGAVADALSIPVVANGDVTSRAEAIAVATSIGAKGIMCARGLLDNPAMFDERNFDSTPSECIIDFIRIALDLGMPFCLFHRHLMFMLDSLLCKSQKRIFNRLNNTPAVLVYLRDNFDLYF